MFERKPEKNSAPIIASSFALGFIVLFFVVYTLHMAASIVIPFVIAVCVWYLINAIARGLSRIEVGGKAIPRFFCFFFAIATLSSGLWFIFELISNNVSNVAAAAPVYQQNFEKVLPELMALLHLEQEAVVQELARYLDLTVVITLLVKMSTGIAGKTLVVLFYTGFLLYEQRFFNRKITGMLANGGNEQRVRQILRNIDIKIQRYIWVKTLISGATGMLTWAWLSYFDVDFSQFWGLMAFVLNFIPYVGSLVAIVLPAAISLIQFGDPSIFVVITLGLSVVQLTLGSIIDPRMLGDNLNLSPIAIIFSLAAWQMIWGIPGMFLSIPILAMVVITLSQFPQTQFIAILLSKTGDIENHEKAKRA